MPTDKYSDITHGNRVVSGEDRSKQSFKRYICKRCGEEKGSRKRIRSHVKKCQPEWSDGLGPKHPRGREPLSKRYTTEKVNA